MLVGWLIDIIVLHRVVNWLFRYVHPLFVILSVMPSMFVEQLQQDVASKS